MKKFIGIVTLPLRKDLIIKKVLPDFIGHTEYLQKMDKKRYSNMILINKKLIISPLTTHLKIKSALNKIKEKDFLYNQIKTLFFCLKKDFNIKKPKIIISGINPHAGENGKIGNEEIFLLKPVIKKLNYNDIKVFGPYSADSMLIKKNLNFYDCFLFMFHDQALIPFKYISKFNGVNYTGNLSVIRTSPDHGTAYDLKGKNNIF